MKNVESASRDALLEPLRKKAMIKTSARNILIQRP
jgi:hypothetical protein